MILPHQKTVNDPEISPEYEHQLVSLVRSGNEADAASAFERIFNSYAVQLADFAYAHLRSRDAARDIVQDIFVSIWTRRASWDVTGSLRSYLYQAIRHKLSNVRRDEHTRTKVHDVLSTDSPQSGISDSETIFEEAELHTTVAAAVRALPVRCRQVFLLSRQEGMSYTQIASTLGIAVKTVDRHMTRALALLRTALKG